MLDIKFIRENKEKLAEAAKNKGIEIDMEHLLTIDKRRIALLQEIEEKRSEKKKLSEMASRLTSEQQAEIAPKGKIIKGEINKLEKEFNKVKNIFDSLMAKVPNIPSPDTPIGKNEEGNVEIYRWGEKPQFDFPPQSHIEIAKNLDLIDFARGTKVAGYRGYYLKNEGALLVMGIMMYALKKMVEAGYVPFIPPTLVNEFALFGSGYFKGLNYDFNTDEIYQVANSDKDQKGVISKNKKFLVGTAEPSLLSYYYNETLKEEDLPVKVCGFSQCYRSEIGSYGKDTKGIYRVHEFMKVEQVVFAKADVEESNKIQEEMLSLSKKLHEDLGLPYRVLQICTGDMSAGKYRAFDIEAWMPGLNRYGETGSSSNFTDWQARRLNVRYVDKSGKKKFVYMLNNTALATPRTLIAILENHQQKDGSVVVPEVLREYVGKERISI